MKQGSEAIEALISNNQPQQSRNRLQYSNFTRAKTLFQQGVPLPGPQKVEGDFGSKGEYFSYLVESPRELFIALHQNRKIIKAQDENGKTLLHHFPEKGKVLSSDIAEIICRQLMDARGVNFSVKDNAGNTPLHAAVLNGGARTTCTAIFPLYVKMAERKDFDFSVKNNEGLTVLHLAAMVQDFRSGKNQKALRGCVDTLFKNAPGKIDVNRLSDSGATAFFYALSHKKPLSMEALLKAGADPYLCGNPEHDPMSWLERFETEIKTGGDALKNAEALKKEAERFRTIIDACIPKPLLLQCIRALPMDTAEEKLDKLPNELIQKIAERRPEISHVQKILAERQAAQTKEKGQEPSV